MKGVKEREGGEGRAEAGDIFMEEEANEGVRGRAGEGGSAIETGVNGEIEGGDMERGGRGGKGDGDEVIFGRAIGGTAGIVVIGFRGREAFNGLRDGIHGGWNL